MIRSSYLVAAVLSSILLEAVAISRLQFIGEQTEETLDLVGNDDDSSLGITLSVPYPFFDKPRNILYVNNNGAITFTTKAQQYDDTEFPRNKYILIAQFWGDVDTREAGTVWYKETTDPVLLTNATQYIKLGFGSQLSFRPTHLFIATWDGVGYYESNSDKTNTFQCVLATDSIDLYVIFLYADIQWTTGDSSGGTMGQGGTPAIVGFNAGDNVNSYSVPGSRTDDIVNINETSNVDVPGVWVFKVSGPSVKSGGCVQDLAVRPDLTLTPSQGNVLGGDTISVSGPCFDSSAVIQCDFEGSAVSAIFVSSLEVLCISPQLPRAGQVNFRLVIDGAIINQYRFTSIAVEKAYQVDVTTETGAVIFTARESVQLHWSPESIFPKNTLSQFQVSIGMYSLNIENGEWDLMYMFDSNSPNDGQELLLIPNNLDPLIDVLPVAFLVSASTNPDTTVRSETLYTELVRLGQRAGCWSSQYYYVNPSVPRETGYHLCQSWYEGEAEGTGTRLRDETAPCPPRESQARAINSGLKEVNYSSYYSSGRYEEQWLYTFHREAAVCFTEKLQSLISSTSQQCCYDNNGDLITGAPSGGSVVKTALAKSRSGHFQDDVRPYLLCCTGNIPSCHKYYEHRPSDNGERYRQPLPAWIVGDPHLVTLDGHKYTFNGKGEFVLIKAQNGFFTLQGRMQQFSNVSATVLTAIVAKESYSDTVMISQSRRGIDAYVNGERVDLSLVSQQEFRNVTVIRGNGTSLSVAFSSGVLITARAENGFLSSFAVVLPDTFRGNAEGLLGNFDRNPTNDLVPKSGSSSLLTNDTAERIYSVFGLSWIVSDDESLFLYLPYESFDDFRDLEFVPIFDNSVPDSDVVDFCGGDKFCIYDTITTNDRDVGVATLAAVADIQDTVEISYPIVCDPPCINGACVSNNTCRCAAGYSGSACNAVNDVRSCQINPCSRGDACAVLGGSYVCTSNCPGSPLCLFIPTGNCSVNHCNNGGICRPSNSTSYGFECLCPSNYTGRLCDIRNDPCTINPCHNGGTCSTNGNSFTCSCPAGYSGDVCESESGTELPLVTITASIAGGVFLIIIVLVLCIVITVACNRSTKRKLTSNEEGKSNTSTLNKSETSEPVPNGVHGRHVRSPTGSSQVNRQLPPPPPSMSNPIRTSPNEQLYEQQDHRHLHRQYQQGNNTNGYHRGLKEDGHHKVTPPPPYEESQDDSHLQQNHLATNPVQSDSSSIDGSTLNNPAVSSSVSPDSSRSNTTSPTSDKELMERAQSPQKYSMSDRSIESASPIGGHGHSHSHQGINLRSTASTPSGPTQQGMKRNLTIPRNFNSQQQLSMSVGQIPARARRHSSSDGYTTTSVTFDGSGVLTMVSEV